MPFLNLMRFYQYLLAIGLFWICAMVCFDQSALATQDESITQIINKGRSRDRYNPRYAKGLLVPSIQFGSGSNYDYEVYDQIRLDYYYSQQTSLFLAIPNFEGDQITLGADYLISGSTDNRTWLGLQLVPASARLGPFARGVYRLSGRSKIHYRGEITVGDNKILTIGSIGYHTYPFLKSKHSYIDIKAKLINDQLEVTQDKLKRSINAYVLSGEIGHGWAYFANVKGLELYASIGLAHSRLQHSTSDCIGSSCEFQDSDTDIRLMVGMLFQHLSI